MIAIAGVERFKGGLRVSFVCGARALARFGRMRAALDDSIKRLSVLPDELATAIGRLQDENKSQRQVIREYVVTEKLKNVSDLEGAVAATNLPPDCCDAIFMRDVYHHVTSVEAFNKSVLASLKPGGRLAIIDFVPRPGSKLPAAVPANRGGHGIPISVVIDELKAAGFTHVRTLDKWPPDDKNPLFLVLFTKPAL